jgi:NhaP-type Na+/H+ or K+/H+ antiporter
VLWEVGIATLFGTLLGYEAGRLLVWAEAKRTIEKTSFLAYTVALSLLVLGAAELIQTDSILAVFVAGVAFDMVVGGRERAEEEGVQEAVNQFFTLPFFTLLGLALPWDQWLALGWPGIALAASVLVLRRLPAVLILTPFIRRLHGLGDAFFFGWFGPIGVAALFYAILALRHTEQEEAWIVGSLLICASIVVHGLTATPFTKLYGRQVQDRKKSG